MVSRQFVFAILLACVLLAPTLSAAPLAPGSLWPNSWVVVMGSPTALFWQPSSGANTYQVQVLYWTGSTWSSGSTYTSNSANFTLYPSYQNTYIAWQVRAGSSSWFSTSWGAYSPWAYFYQQGQSHLTQNPTQLDLSTGDTSRAITTSLTPSNVSYTPNFNTSLLSNPSSSCQVGLAFSLKSGTGMLSSIVTARNAGCSGIFNVVSSAGTTTSTNSTQVTVPPQIMIQTLYGEAGAQNSSGDDTMPAILVVAKNRFGDGSFPGGSTRTWQSVLIPSQFYGASNTISYGLDPELSYAASAFSGTSTVSVPSDCKGYWSPTNQQFQTLQTWSNTPANKISDASWQQSVGAPTFWRNQAKQAVIKNSIALNRRSGSTSAPAIVLFRLAPTATSPAVVRIP